MNCEICGQAFTADHSCAGGAPTSNLPEPARYKPLESLDGKIVGMVCVGCGRLRGAPHRQYCPLAPEPLVSISIMNRRIAEAVAWERKMCAEILQEASIEAHRREISRESGRSARCMGAD